MPGITFFTMPPWSPSSTSLPEPPLTVSLVLAPPTNWSTCSLNVCCSDVFCPPLAVPPVSLTRKSKDEPAFSPTLEASGLNTSLPPSRSALLISWPWVTGFPLRNSVPPDGRESMITDCRLWPSTGSENAKSSASNL
ncbi:hypothetical protein D3C71_1262940 [compost metagenome]